jgi:hypothetical protein
VQGGDLELAMRSGLRSDMMGLLIPISRGISKAANPKKAAEEISRNINEKRNAIQTSFKRSMKTKASNKFSDDFILLGCSGAGCIHWSHLKSVSFLYIDSYVGSFQGCLNRWVNRTSNIK